MIVVRFDDNCKRVYPPCETAKCRHAASRRLGSVMFSDVQVALRFYSSKFNEYHPSIIRQVSREVTR